MAFEMSPVATIYAENRIIRRANAAFAAMFELPPDEIQGLPLEIFYPSPTDSDRAVRHVQAALRETGYVTDERAMQRRGGGIFWCAVSGHSIDQADPLSRAVWCFQDLSSQWRMSELSPRDREIAILVSGGLTAKEVARMLDLSPRTVETYLARVRHKLEVRNVAELVSRIRPTREGNTL